MTWYKPWTWFGCQHEVEWRNVPMYFGTSVYVGRKWDSNKIVPCTENGERLRKQEAFCGKCGSSLRKVNGKWTDLYLYACEIGGGERYIKQDGSVYNGMPILKEEPLQKTLDEYKNNDR